MAIAVDSISRVDAYTNYEPDWNHTVSGSDRLLIVSVDCSRGSSPRGVNSATYNGDSMTQVQGWYSSTTSLQTFYLINPDTGTHKVKINITDVDSAYTVEVVAMSLTGVHQTTPIGEFDKFRGAVTASTTETVTLDGLWGNSWVFGSSNSWDDTASTGTAIIGSGETSRWNNGYTDSNLDGRIHTGSTVLNSSVGSSQDIDRTFSVSGYAVIMACEIRSADGYGGLTFTTNPKLSSSIDIQSNKVFSTNPVLSTMFSKITGTSLSFIIGIKVSATFARQLFINISENIKLTSSLSRIQTKTLNSTVKLTSSITKKIVSLVDFTTNLSLSSTIRIIKDGIRVGIWEKVVKTTSDWTKQAKSTSIWTKQDKEL